MPPSVGYCLRVTSERYGPVRLNMHWYHVCVMLSCSAAIGQVTRAYLNRDRCPVPRHTVV